MNDQNPNETELANVNTQLALIVQQNQQMAVLMKSNHEETRAWYQDHEARIRSLERGVVEISARQTMMSLIQGSFTAVASAIAAIVGRQ